jgi:D-alanyl-lipoteichoic acid acyltransferase DltB (MBOAT superfamily)
MLFPTIRFALFLAAVLPLSWLLMPNRLRWRVFMVAASWFFYGSWDWRFVGLLAASTFANQAFAQRIDRAPGERSRRYWLTLAVVANLGVLGWFKYAGFFAENAVGLLHLVGIEAEPPLGDLVLPVGISFFTFQALSYVIDVYRRKLHPDTLLAFAVYLSFFPHLVAGPIVRAREFLPQLRQRRNPRRVDATLAFWLIAAGLLKKVVVASYLADRAVDPLFAFPFQHGGVEALVGVYAYAIQIYADFSGYTDIAIGVALLLGFRFPQNFDAPYTATSLQDFWRRWHMTLSRWLRDYLYIPLGGGHGTRAQTYRNLFLTMLLGGLWHGAAWTFVLWGALHGGGLAVERWWDELRGRRRPPSGVPDAEVAEVAVSTPPAPVAPATGGGVAVALADPEAPPEPPLAPRVGVAPAAARTALATWARRVVTFHVVCLGWVLFRAGSLGTALEVLGRIVAPGASAVTAVNAVVVLVVAGMLASQYVSAERVAAAQAAVSRWPMLAQAAALAGVVVLLDVLGPAGVAPFIYFQF